MLDGNTKENQSEVLLPVGENMKSYVYSDTLQYQEVKGKDGKTHYQTKGFVAMGNKDQVGDVITPEAIKGMVEQINSSDMTFYGSYDHEHIVSGNRSMPPRSRIIDAEEATKTCSDGNVYKGVYITDELNEFHPEFSNYKGMMENDWLGSYSIEFLKPQAGEFTRTDDGRILNHVNMTGYAHTARPINPECSMNEFVAKSLADLDHTAESDNCAADSVDVKTTEETKMEDKPETPTEEPKTEAPAEEVKEEAPAESEAKPEEAEPEAKPEEPAAEPEAPAEEEGKSELLSELKQLREEIKSLKEDTKAKNILSEKEEKFEQVKALDGDFGDIYLRALGGKK